MFEYDGAQLDAYADWSSEARRVREEYGTECVPYVKELVAFDNTSANGLGTPLPAGQLQYYGGASKHEVSMTDDRIGHTPEGAAIRVDIGNAEGLVGDRECTGFDIDRDNRRIDESFRITLRNHLEEQATVRVVEHLYRAANWKIDKASADYHKVDDQAIEFPVTVDRDGEATITYTVHYEW